MYPTCIPQGNVEDQETTITFHCNLNLKYEEDITEKGKLIKKLEEQIQVSSFVSVDVSFIFMLWNL